MWHAEILQTETKGRGIKTWWGLQDENGAWIKRGFLYGLWPPSPKETTNDKAEAHSWSDKQLDQMFEWARSNGLPLVSS